MPAIEVTVNHPVGLHARPAALFVQTAATFACDIRVSNLTSGSAAGDAKSILSVLALGVGKGHIIRIEADGQGADQALAAIRRLVEGNFGEDHRSGDP